MKNIIYCSSQYPRFSHNCTLFWHPLQWWFIWHPLQWWFVWHPLPCGDVTSAQLALVPLCSVVVQSVILSGVRQCRVEPGKRIFWASVLTFVCCQLGSGFTLWKENHHLLWSCRLLAAWFLCYNKVTVDPTCLPCYLFYLMGWKGMSGYISAESEIVSRWP